MSSWFDPYPLTATSNYIGLKRAGRGPQRLILGPWTHGDRSDHCFGDVEFGPDAPLDSWAGDWRAYRLRFFDHVVKGAALDEPAVRVFVMGGGSGRRDAAGHLEHGGRWIAADRLAAARRRTSCRSTCMATAGWTAPPRPPDAAPLSYDFDPAHPVPTIGGAMSSLEPVAYAGSWDQMEGPGFFGCSPPYLPLASRPDVLVFQTAPLREPVQVVGPIEAELWVATDGPDTDFTAKLIDVHPPSRRLSARLRDDPDRRHPAAALRRGSVAAAAAPAGRGGARAHHAVPHGEPVPARAPHPAGRVVEQLPEIRRQPEHRRAGGAGAAAARRGEHGVRRCRPAEPGDAAAVAGAIIRSVNGR